jgi:hypothetical protein
MRKGFPKWKGPNFITNRLKNMCLLVCLIITYFKLHVSIEIHVGVPQNQEVTDWGPKRALDLETYPCHTSDPTTMAHIYAHHGLESLLPPCIAILEIVPIDPN